MHMIISYTYTLILLVLEIFVVCTGLSLENQVQAVDVIYYSLSLLHIFSFFLVRTF